MIHELRFAFRSIGRNKLFSLTVLLGFALGIGATTLVFSVVDAVLLRPVTFKDPGAMVSVQALQNQRGWDNVTPLAFDRLRARKDVFSQVVGFRTAIFTVTRVAAPDQVFGLSVSPELFSMIDAQPWRGRLMLPSDEKPDAAPVVLISYKAWQQLFASNPAILGKTAEIDGELHTVIGVMPRNFVIPGNTGLLWTPLKLTAAELSATNGRWVNVLAHLQPHVNEARSQSIVDAVAAAAPRIDGKPMRLRIRPWRNETNKTYQEVLWLALGMVSGLLVLGCANLSSLLLARAITRQREFAVRLATGAGRLQLIRQSLLEVFLLASAGLLLAWGGASWGLDVVRQFLSAAPTGMHDLARIHLSATALFFSFAVALLATLLCGLFPALFATSIDLSTSLREGGTKMASSQTVRRFLRSLIVVEAGIAMLLLLTSGILTRSLVRLMADDHGLKPEHVLTLRLPTGSYQRFSTKQSDEDRQRRIQQYVAMMRQAQSIDGVQAIALASSLPLSRAVVRTEMKAPNTTTSADTPLLLPITQAVTRDYFRVMGIPVLAGRAFEPRDAGSKLQFPALVNESFVRKYFNGKNPVGELLDAGEKQPTRIIGVVKDSPHLDYSEQQIEPELYFDFEQTLMTPFLTGMVVRTTVDPRAMEGQLRSALSIQNNDQAVVQVRTLESLISENTWQPRFSAWLFATFAVLAICLAGLGIYGVVAYVTAARRRDFSIRLALGANPLSLFRLATFQSLSPVFLGVLIGTGASYWTGQWIAALLYKTRPLDVLTLVASASVLMVVALAASIAPALHAARVDPSISLRSE